MVNGTAVFCGRLVLTLKLPVPAMGGAFVSA
jgi:hypothetical protein